MPLLTIETNIELDDSRARNLAATASARIADTLGKPEHYVMVSVRRNPAMCFGGSDAPLAYLELKSLGLPEERTAEFSNALAAFLQQELALAADRVYIEFASPARHMWGYDGGTF
ncbi:MAG TPA: hypothetical protein ENJ79_04070 [Gammaproteobacteria bacterium]|nr:hypothetical protein [Gammaproteobacteria bacterium]